MNKILTLLFVLGCIFQSFSQTRPARPTGISASQLAVTNSMRVDYTLSTSTSTIGYQITALQVGGSANKVERVGNVNNATLNGLTFNSTYKVYVRAFRIGATATDTLYSDKSDSVNVLIAGLVAPDFDEIPQTVNIDPSKLTIFINDNNAHESGFEIEVTGPTDADPLRILRTTQTGTSVAFTITGLTQPSTFYSVRVRAFRNSFPGPWSGYKQLKTPQDYPPTPLLVGLKTCPTFAGVSWSVPSRLSDVSYFVLEKSYDNVNFNVILNNINPTKTEHYDNDVVPGNTAFYRIAAINNTGNRKSNVFSTFIRPYQKPGAPLNIISNEQLKTNTSITAQWSLPAEDQVCGIDKRAETIVFYRLDETGEFVLFDRLPPFAQSVVIPNIKPKQVVEVQVFFLSDKGIKSDAVTIKIQTQGPPVPPINLIGVSSPPLPKDALGNNYITLEWFDVANDEDWFIIERSSDNINFYELAKIKKNTNKLTDLAVEEGVIYYYRMKAGSILYGNGQYSKVIGPFILNYSVKPNAPTGLFLKQAGTKVNISWRDDSDKEENYIIERSGDAGANYSVVATLGRNITKYVDENVSLGKSYKYRAKASNSVGSSNYSNPVDITLTASAKTDNNVSIYPNPFSESISIKFENALDLKKSYSIKIYNQANNIVFDNKVKAINENEILLNINNIVPGLYSLIIENELGVSSKRILKL